MVIISLVIYTFTMEKIRSIAIMKLIGAPNLVIIRMVLEESLLLTCGSFLFGLILISNTYQLFPRRVVLLAGDDLITFLIALLGGIPGQRPGGPSGPEDRACPGPGRAVMAVLRFRGPEQDIRVRPPGGAGPGGR